MLNMFPRKKSKEAPAELLDFNIIKNLMNEDDQVHLAATIRKAYEKSDIRLGLKIITTLKEIAEKQGITLRDDDVKNFLQRFIAEQNVFSQSVETTTEAVAAVLTTEQPTEESNVIPFKRPAFALTEQESSLDATPAPDGDDMFDGLEPVAEAIKLSPEIIEARQLLLKMGISQEANKKSAQPIQFTPGSAPKLPEWQPHVPGGTPNLTWTPPTANDTLHKRPTEHLR